jgi:hypothetical protein
MATTPCGIIKGWSELFKAESLSQVTAFLAQLYPIDCDESTIPSKKRFDRFAHFPVGLF